MSTPVTFAGGESGPFHGSNAALVVYQDRGGTDSGAGGYQINLEIPAIHPDPVKATSLPWLAWVEDLQAIVEAGRPNIVAAIELAGSPDMIIVQYPELTMNVSPTEAQPSKQDLERQVETLNQERTDIYNSPVLYFPR